MICNMCLIRVFRGPHLYWSVCYSWCMTPGEKSAAHECTCPDFQKQSIRKDRTKKSSRNSELELLECKVAIYFWRAIVASIGSTHDCGICLGNRLRPATAVEAATLTAGAPYSCQKLRFFAPVSLETWCLMRTDKTRRFSFRLSSRVGSYGTSRTSI